MKKQTKSDLIAVLVGAKKGTHTSLQRATLAGLQAMVDELPAQKQEPLPQPVEAPKTKMVLAEKLTVGMTVVGTRKREAVRIIGRISIGKKHVTIFDESGRDFGYWTLGTRVEVIG